MGLAVSCSILSFLPVLAELILVGVLILARLRLRVFISTGLRIDVRVGLPILNGRQRPAALFLKNPGGYQVSGIGYPVLGIRYQVLVSDIRY